MFFYLISTLKNKKFIIFVPSCLFLVSLVISLLLLYEYRSHILFDHINPVTDSVGFLNQAKSLYSDNFIGQGVFNQEPGYAYYLAIIMMFFGDDLFTIRLFQVITASFTVVLVYFTSFFLFKNYYASICSAILLILTGVHYFYSLIILRPFLIPFFMLVSFILFSFAMKKDNIKLFLVSGIFTAISFFVRPTAISFFIAVVLVLFFYNKKYIIYFVSGFLIIFSILVMRNLIADADLFSFSTKGPQEFASGNILESKGVGWIEHPKQMEYYKKYKSLSKVMYNVIKDSLLESPVDYFLLKLNKTIAVFYNHEIPNNYSFNYYKKYFIPRVRFLFVNFGIVFICFAFALPEIKFLKFNCLKKKYSINQKLQITYFITLFMYFGTLLAFYIISRFRFPFLVLLVPVSGFGLVSLYNNIRNKKTKKIVYQIIAGLIALYITFFYPLKGLNKNYNMALAYANDGSTLSRLNKTEKAIDNYKKALSYYAPEIGFVTLVRLLINSNQLEDALFYSSEGLKNYPNSVDLTYFNAFINIRLNNYNESVKYLLRLPDTPQYKSFKYYNLAVGYYHLNDYNKSLVYWEKYYEQNPDDEKAFLNIQTLRNWQKRQ